MVKTFTPILLLIFLFLFAFPVFSQVAVDQDFKPIFTNDFADINAMAQQADGKIIVGGNFTFVNASPFTNLARLNADGTPDLSFNIGLGPNNFVERIQVLPDQKILVTGGFTTFNGQAVPSLVRLNPDGSVDHTFLRPADFNFISASGIVVQADGKMLFSGVFYLYGQERYTSAIRLHADGSLDKTFASQVSNKYQGGLVQQADGKILLGGQGDQPGEVLIRLNPDGTRDNTFTPNTGVITQGVRALALQEEKIIVTGTGQPSSSFGVGITKVVRLEADGSLDSSFPTGSLVNDIDFISQVKVLPNKKILLAGYFHSYNGNAISSLCQLNQDGSFDLSFNNEVKQQSVIRQLIVQEHEKIMVAGAHISIIGSLKPNAVFRLQGNGSLDNSHDPALHIGSKGIINKVALTADHKVLAVGQVAALNGHPAQAVVRLTAAGEQDETFSTGQVGYSNIRLLQQQPDGKILIGGDLDHRALFPFKPLKRLHADGTPDATFDVSLPGLNSIYAMALQPDGKIIILAAYQDWVCNQVLRLNADGSKDETFQPALATTSAQQHGGVLLYGVGLQSDGSILVAGNFEAINGTARHLIARLQPTGALDETFTGPAFANVNHIYTIAVQPDDKILMGGSFILTDQPLPTGILRLQPTGQVDETFGGTLAGSPNAIFVEASGKIVVGGNFNKANGASRLNLARFNSNGSVDNGFNLSGGVNGPVTSVAVLQQDGTTYIGGLFSQVNGAFHYSLARILPPLPAAPANIFASLSPPNEAVLSWTDQANNELGYEIQRSTSATTGFAVIHTTAANASTFTDKNLQGGTTYYYRIRSFNSRGPADFSAGLSLTTEKLNQTISFHPPADQEADAAPITLQASSSSGLPVSFTLVSGPATLNQNQVSITGAGVISIKASQQGSVNFHPAQEVIQQFTVHQANPTTLQVSNITATGLMLKWEGQSPEFKVLRKTTASSTSPDDGEVVYEGPDKTFTFTTQLHPGSAYFFTVYGKAAGTALYSRQSKKLATSTAAPAVGQVSIMAFLAGETGKKTAPNAPVSVTMTQAATQDGYIQVTTAANPTAPALPAGIKRLYAEKYWKVTAVGMQAGTMQYALAIDLKGLPNLPAISQVTILQRSQADQPWGDLLSQHPEVQQTFQDSVLVLTNLSFFPEIALGVQMVTGIEKDAPLTFRLEQNYPNPFDHNTSVSYHLRQKAEVLLEVIDGQGKVVHRLVQQVQPPGSYQVLLEAKNLKNRSLYFIRLQANGEKSVVKAVYQ